MFAHVKGTMDDEVMHNENILENENYFRKSVLRAVILSCNQGNISYSLEQANGIADDISHEYFEERRKAS